MNRSVIMAVALLFITTLAAGFLTPNEVEEVKEILTEVWQEENTIEEEEIAPEKPVATVTVASTTPTPSTSETELYTVVRVIDGDTIVINKAGVNETVRLIGIDTPETVHPSKPVQCFGEEASKKTKEWLEGREVTLEVDESEGERDKYRRLLGYVYRDDGLFVNLDLIKQGYAFEYTYVTPYKYQAEFKAAEAEASAALNGLWAHDECL